MCKIRIATEADIPLLKKLFQETILHINIKDYTTQQARYWANRGENNDVWKKWIRTQYFVIAEIEDEIVGFASLVADGHLHFLFVHKDYQRKGIASSLLDHIESYAQKDGIKEITADVSITARPFFENRGYKVLCQQTVNIGVDMINFKMKKNYLP